MLEAGIEDGSGGGVWAEFGAGTGAFTLALRDLAGPDVEIFAVDQDGGSLRSLRNSIERYFPGTRLHLLHQDFAAALQLPPLDGILAANSIHYDPDPVRLLRHWRAYLKPEGRLIVVEYDTDLGNRWVPYPLSFTTFGEVAQEAGFTKPVLIGTHGSRFLGGFYAALSSAP